MKLVEKNYVIKLAVTVIFVFIFFPNLVRAADFFFDSSSEKIYKDDTFVVKLKLSTADNLINAVEGSLSFDNSKLEVKEISTGGSIFSLWPKPAVFLNEKGKISFVGGVMGGFQGVDAEILKIIFTAKKEGAADLQFEKDSSLFLNDGKGTKVSFKAKPFRVSILERPEGLVPKDEWQPLLKQDMTQPEPFELIVDKIPFVFEGDYFVSFFTTDKDSGIDHYEIREGDGGLIKAESPYRLKDQSLRSKIEVKALDKAGNERLVVLQPLHPEKIYQKFLFWGIIILILLVALGFFFRKKKRSKPGKFIRSRK